MKHRHIEIGIDKLVLEGFTSGDGERIKASVERELTRLLIERGVPASLTQGTGVSRLSGGQIEITRNPDVKPNGKQIAHAIYGAITK